MYNLMEAYATIRYGLVEPIIEEKRSKKSREKELEELYSQLGNLADDNDEELKDKICRKIECLLQNS